MSQPFKSPRPEAPSQQVVVVTGASAGVGRATAIEFAGRGAKVALLARGRAGLEGARRDVEAAGGTALVIPTDVSDADAVEAAAERVERELGPIDVWVNDAMASVFSPVREMTPADFRRVTEVTYLGVVNGTLAALKRMLPRDQGRIVQVGSALAYRGIPLQAAYCASKHAIQGFCDSLRSELLHDKSHVTVSMVQLPAVNTPQFSWVKSRLPNMAQPVPPIYQPEVPARAILYAADTGSREVFVGLPSVITIWGNKLLPGLGDLYLARTGYNSQQTDQKRDPEAPNNLYQPVDEERDHGVHGAFDDRAHASSPQLWAVEHRNLLLGVAGALALGALLLGRNA